MDFDEFIYIENRLNKETTASEDFINKLKKEINISKLNDDSTIISLPDSIIVYSPLLNVPIVNKLNIKLEIKFPDRDKSINKELSITCSIKSILTDLATEWYLKYFENYMLKIHGKEEYLPINEMLCDLKYIRNCLCLNVDPVFVLVKLENINQQLGFKRKIDYETKFQFQLNRKNLSFIQKSKFEQVLDSIVYNYKGFNQAIQDNDKRLSLCFCERFRLKFKELTNTVFGIKYTPFLTFTILLEKQEILIKDDKSIEIKSIEFEKLSSSVKNLLDMCKKFCNCASKCFYWYFEIKYFKPVPELLTESKTKISVYVESLSNLFDD
jgi:hypothetical protein